MKAALPIWDYMELLARKDKTNGQTQTLQEHLSGTAELCEKFADVCGLSCYGKILGQLHDIGKMNPDFQRKLETDENILVDHSGEAGLIYDSMNCLSPVAKEMLGLISVSHHGGLINSVGHAGKTEYADRLKNAAERNAGAGFTVDDALALAEKLTGKVKFPSDDKALNTLLAQLAADKSEGDYIQNCFALIVKFLYSCLIDADRYNSMTAFENVKYSEKCVTEEMVECVDRYVKALPKNDLSKIRNEIYSSASLNAEKDSRLFTMEVPTGGGKTLASLKFALKHAVQHQKKRVIYVIPYLSVIEQNAEVIEKALGKSGFGAVTESHSNIVTKENDGGKFAARSYSPSDDYNSPIVITTMVQFLENVYGSGTRGIRRFHNYAESVIIFDEIQNLPINCFCLFDVLINFLIKAAKSTVVLCSATQPLLTDLPKSVASYSLPAALPAVTVDDLSALKRTKIVDLTYSDKRQRSTDIDEVATLAESVLSQVDSLLIVASTKKVALSLYQKLINRTDCDVKYLSANMCAEHRLKVINELKQVLPKRAGKTLCVSTQLIEAGVDLDFDSVIRYASGADSILQAAGRCNREGKLKDENGNKVLGEVRTVYYANENLSKLPDLYLTRKIYLETKAAFFDIEADDKRFLKEYYKRLYVDAENVMKYPLKDDGRLGFDTSETELLGENFKRWKDSGAALRQSFKDAAEHFSVIGGEQTGVIVPYGKGKEIINSLLSKHPDYSLLKQAQRYTVNVYGEMPDKLNVTEVGQHGVYVLTDENKYDINTGIVYESKGGMSYFDI